ncbi:MULTISPECIES: DUF6090 family protein [Aquimarina]|uniref:DUF6090 family protein n=1 Tax=Aquimarina TaxID=290174 RepID=UPI0009426C0E|nr:MULTISPECIES: DUF6090 family protein [Aquimarina]
MKKINWQYTLGEILIVIVGITIAFNLNQCAEEKKDKNLRDTYLENLKIDILADKEELTKNLKTLVKYKKDAETIAKVLNDTTIENYTITTKVFSISPLIEFTPQDITYKTLVNSGDFTLFNDISLKSAIQKHYSSDLQKVTKAYERQEIIHREYLGKYYIYNSDFDKMKKKEFPFEDVRLLKRIVQSLGGAYTIQISATEMAITHCDSILKLINP